MPTIENAMVLSIANDFTRNPGPRYMKEGPFSGELFREQKLIHAFESAQKSGQKLLIDLDGGYGFATSFLEEAFGGLARKYGSKAVNAVLEFKSEEEPGLISNVRDYIDQRKPKA